MRDSVNILCLKWGTLYSAEYVNRLYRGVKMHLHRPFRFVCVTEDSSGLVEGVETAPIPPKPPNMEFMGWYDKWPNIYIKGYRGRHLNTRTKPAAWVWELWER